MKILEFLKVSLISAVILVCAGCTEKVGTVESTLDENITFTLKEDVIYLQSAAIRVKHDGDEGIQWVYMQTDDLTTDADELIAQRVRVESELTDQIVSHKGKNKSLTLKNLEAKKYYRLIVKAIDPVTGNLYGKVADFVFKTRRDPDVWEVNGNWSLTRKAERSSGVVEGTSEVAEFENFECKSADDEAYMVLTISKDDFESYKKDDSHADKIRTIFEDYYNDMVAAGSLDELVLKGDAVWKEQRLRSGDYVTFMIGLDDDNELSGLYKRTDVTILQEQPTEEYNKWLGWWRISFADGTAPWDVYIDDLDANMWYLSMGWEPAAISEPVYNMGLKLYFDKSSGKIYFISQEVASSEDGSVINYYSTFKYGTYQTVLDVYNIRLAEASMTDLNSTQARINGLGTTLAGVGEVQFTYSLFYISYSADSSIAASLDVPDYPWTMTKIADPTK